MLRSVLALGLTLCFATIAFAQELPDAVRIAFLIQKLDAEAFEDRKAAQMALVRLEEPALNEAVKMLKKAAVEGRSAEVRQGAALALKEIEKALVRKLPVKIADIIALTKDAEKGKVDAEKMELLLDRLMEILAKDTGTERKLPVRFDDVTAGVARRQLHNKKLILLESGDVGMIENSIVIASSIATTAQAENSIIIAGIAAHTPHTQNCIVIAGEHISSAFAHRSSMLLSGGGLSIAGSDRNTILGAALHLSATSPSTPGTIYLNRPVPAEDVPAALRDQFEPPRSMTSKGVVLEMPPRDEPLKNLLNVSDLISLSSGRVLLFRRTKTGGEYFARAGQELRSPEGEALPELAGWKLEHIEEEFAVLLKDGKRTVLRKPVRGE